MTRYESFSSSQADLSVTVQDQVATVTLNRPAQRNAVTYAMWSGIPTLCSQLEMDPNVRVVVWRGAGDDAFSSGGDIGEFAHFRSNRIQAQQYNDRVDTALSAVRNLSKPTLAAIKGYCLGGGFLLAAYCDLRIAADNARFSIPVAKLGAVVTFAQMACFVELLGAMVARDLLLTGRIVDAPEARILGLCSQVHPLARFDEVVDTLTAKMTQLSPLSQQRHKQMLDLVLHQPDLSRLTPAQRALEAEVFDSNDYTEGTKAFLEKRTPSFIGR